MVAAAAKEGQYFPETVLTRLIPRGALARLALPAVLTRLIAPVLAGVVVVPVASIAASFTAVATAVTLGTAAKVPVADFPELLAIVGVVAVDVVEDEKWAAALG